MKDIEKIMGSLADTRELAEHILEMHEKCEDLQYTKTALCDTLGEALAYLQRARRDGIEACEDYPVPLSVFLEKIDKFLGMDEPKSSCCSVHAGSTQECER